MKRYPALFLIIIFTFNFVSANNTPEGEFRETEINIQVSNYELAKQNIYLLATNCKAEIKSENENRYLGKINNTIVILVPNNLYDSLFYNILATASEIFSQKIVVVEVAKQYQDIDQQLSDKLQIRKRYASLLETSKNVRDTKDLEQNITSISEEIKKLEDRLLRLQKNNISTITVHIVYRSNIEQVITAEDNFIDLSKQSVTKILKQSVWFVVPLIAIIVAIVYLIKRYRAKKRHKKTRKKIQFLDDKKS